MHNVNKLYIIRTMYHQIVFVCQPNELLVFFFVSYIWSQCKKLKDVKIHGRLQHGRHLRAFPPPAIAPPPTAVTSLSSASAEKNRDLVSSSALSSSWPPTFRRNMLTSMQHYSPWWSCNGYMNTLINLLYIYPFKYHHYVGII